MRKGFGNRKPEHQAYIKFIKSVLEAINKNQDNSQIVYSLLHRNLDKLDENFAEELRCWARGKLYSSTSIEAQKIASDITIFVRWLWEYPSVTKSRKYEPVITGYDIALSIFDRKAFTIQWAHLQNELGIVHYEGKEVNPKNIDLAINCWQNALGVLAEGTDDWATLISNLANAYSEEPEGIEQAIEFYEQALRVHTKEAYPYEWARIQNNLGLTYIDRIEGNKAENIEQAINCYKKALQIYTHKAYPPEWATLRSQLGSAYSKRLKVDRGKNIEIAIKCYKLALRVLDKSSFEWAAVQNNLANAYVNRIEGDHVENFEQAIACFEQALKGHIEPFKQVQTLNNLATAYLYRVKSNRAANIEKAIICCKHALEIRTKENFAYEWAGTINNLGLAYSYRTEDKAKNIEQAINCYQEALEIRTKEAHTAEWADTINNLGLAYSERNEGDDIKQAIACYESILQLYLTKDFDYLWARTQNNFGLAYEKIEENKDENIEHAINCYQRALSFYTVKGYRYEYLRTSINLGNIAFKNERWNLAIESYRQAIKASEELRTSAVNYANKETITKSSMGVYFNIVQAFINTKQYTEAIEYVERSKTRNLVELLATHNLYPKGDIPQPVLSQLTNLRRAISQEQKRLEIEDRNRQFNRRLSFELNQTQAILTDSTQLNQLQKQLDDLITREIDPIDPSFSLTQKVEPISYEDIQSLPDEYTAIVEWYITKYKFFAFIITRRNPHPQVWQSSTQDGRNLGIWGREYLRTYQNNREQWKLALEIRLQELSEILHFDEILSLIPVECDRLVFIPHLALHLLPLHALPLSPESQVQRESKGKYLSDYFSRGIQYSPSCQLLKLAQNQQHSNFCNLFAIHPPSNDLLYTKLEVEIIRSLFNAEVLRENATKSAVKEYLNPSPVHCVHFACHGKFNWNSPLESDLLLAKKETLTLEEIFNLSLPQCRLVTLSACETGLTDLTSLSDEYIGLPNGFIFSGSPSVVSSLWAVPDISTAFLIIKFYENLTDKLRSYSNPNEGDVSIALQNAQKWLRDLTSDEAEILLKKREPYIETIYSGKPRSKESFKAGALRQIKEKGFHPFNEPYYWAAFVAIGL